MKIRSIGEDCVSSKRLGRHLEHDPRSRNYAFTAPTMSYASVTHTLNLPVLDQGSLGACTGFAAEVCCGASPFFEAIPGTVSARPIQNALKAQRQAVTLYSIATTLDPFSGNYPPKDTGSTGLAAAKACQKSGLISGYLHTFTFEDCLKALTLTPVMVGVNWYSGFDRPSKDGRVSVSGSIRGGHEFLLYGIDAQNKLVRARNSWGIRWGASGDFLISFDDLSRLLSEEGDCTVLVPLSSPAPIPNTPTPEPAPAATPDQVLAAAFEVWKKAKGL